jgi:hypothetical protein
MADLQSLKIVMAYFQLTFFHNKGWVRILLPKQQSLSSLKRPARRYCGMTCSPVMGRKVEDILQILGGGLIPYIRLYRVFLS